MTTTIDPIDAHVGAQIRDRRTAARKTQSELGAFLGVTFQQVQKYERGTNRVSASMLFRAAEFLDCAPGELFPLGAWQPAEHLRMQRRTIDVSLSYRLRADGTLEIISAAPVAS